MDPDINTPAPAQDKRALLRWWILAWLVSTFACYFLGSAIAAAWVLPPGLGALIGGAILGGTQWWVLRKYGLPIYWATWVAVTIAGYLALLDLFALSSLVLSHTGSTTQADMLIGIVLMIIGGAVVSLPQWWVLRGYVQHPGWWLLAHGVGALLVTLIMAGFFYMNEYTNTQRSLILTDLVISVVGGIVTGQALAFLLRQPRMVTPGVERPRRLAWLGSLTMLGVLAAGSWSLPVLHQPHITNPIIYPDAQQVQTQPLAQDNQYAIGEGIQRTSFQTHASPEAVLAFYRDMMTKDGWELDDLHAPKPETNTLDFYLLHDCPWHSLIVNAAPTSQELTNVTIDVYINGCY